MVILAPGDRGLAHDPAPTLIARTFVQAGLRVARFDAPPSDDHQAARDEAIAACIRRAASEVRPAQTLVVGGLSRGARVSASMSEALGASGLVLFAYPFHPRRDTDCGDRVTQLARLTLPVWLGQGTRDTHGNQQQVRGYRLPAHIQVHWLQGANHALVPRPRSGQSQAGQLALAAAEAAAFILAL